MMLSLSTKIIAIVLGLGLASPIYAVEIINNVSSSASTGGNSAAPAGGGQAGEVIQGESKAEVRIYTEVDGEIVTNIDETMVAPVGEKAVIEKNIEVNLPSVKSSISVEVEASGENSSTTTAKIVQSSILHTAVSPVLAFLNKIFNYVLSIFS